MESFRLLLSFQFKRTRKERVEPNACLLAAAITLLRTKHPLIALNMDLEELAMMTKTGVETVEDQALVQIN